MTGVIVDAWSMCDIYAEKSDALQRTICCSVEYPWNETMSPAEKKNRIENSMSNLNKLW